MTWKKRRRCSFYAFRFISAGCCSTNGAVSQHICRFHFHKLRGKRWASFPPSSSPCFYLLMGTSQQKATTFPLFALDPRWSSPSAKDVTIWAKWFWRGSKLFREAITRWKNSILRCARRTDGTSRGGVGPWRWWWFSDWKTFFEKTLKV